MSAVDDSSGVVTRRGFLRLAGAGAGAATIGTGFTDAAEAFTWGDVSTGGGAATPGGAYLTREVLDMTGGETVESGTSTPEAIAESWWRTGRYAREHDEVMLKTFWNRLEDARTIAYLRAKTAAIEAMDDGAEQSVVLEDAQTALGEYYAIVQQNLINNWNVQASKITTASQEFIDHDEVSNPEDFVALSVYWESTEDNSSDVQTSSPTTSDRSIELVDGSTAEATVFSHSIERNPVDLHFEYDLEIGPNNPDIVKSTNSLRVEDIYLNWSIPSTLDGVEADSNVNWWMYNPSEGPTTYSDAQTQVEDEGAVFEVSFGALNQYLILWDGIIDQHDQMLDNVEEWVDEAYGEVQAGEVDVSTLVANDPMMLADQWSSDYQDTGHLAYAAADLATLGLSFDSDNRMVFELDDGTELEGTIYMSESSFEFEVGTEIDPNADGNGDFYVAADATTMQRELPSEEYRAGIDGGELKLNVAPVEDTEYHLTTTAGEEVAVAAEAFSIDEDDDANSDVELIENAESVVVDLSEDLETPITEVESILHLQAGDDEAMVMELTEPFTITEAYDVESGDEVDTVSGEGYNAGTSSVDLSWTETYLEMRDNTDDYAANEGGGGGGISFPDLGNIGIPGSGIGLIGSALQFAILAAAAYLGYDVFLSDS